MPYLCGKEKRREGAGLLGGGALSLSPWDCQNPYKVGRFSGVRGEGVLPYRVGISLLFGIFFYVFLKSIWLVTSGIKSPWVLAVLAS